MALFGRGNSELGGIIKRLESKSYRGPGEKRQLLELLGTFADIRTDVLARFLTGTDGDLARFAMDRLAATPGVPSLDLLLSALQRTPRGRWRPLMAAIHRRGDTVELGERLGHMLRSSRAESREVAVEVVGQDPGWARHLGLLKTALRDEEPGIRRRAVEIVGQGTRESTPRMLLRELLYNTDDVVRHAAIDAFARQPHTDVIEDFFDLLPNEAPAQQDQILRGLKRLLAAEGTVSEGVQDRILPLLAAEDERIRLAAAQLLGSIPDKLYVLRRFFQYAKGIAFWLRDRAFAAVAGVADDVVEAILSLLRDDDLDVVVGAVTMAGKSGDPRLVDGLWGVLQREDLDWWVKIPALEMLAVYDHPDVERMLVEQLGVDDLRTAALAALGGRGRTSALPHIMPFLGHPRASARRAALTALQGFQEPLVLKALDQVAREDANEECRMVAIEMLETMGPAGVAAATAIREVVRRPRGVADDGPSLTMLRADDE